MEAKRYPFNPALLSRHPKFLPIYILAPRSRYFNPNTSCEAVDPVTKGPSSPRKRLMTTYSGVFSLSSTLPFTFPPPECGACLRTPPRGATAAMMTAAWRWPARLWARPEQAAPPREAARRQEADSRCPLDYSGSDL